MDLDRNRIKDYWTGDVATLMDLGSDKYPLIAGADTAPLNALVSKPVPFHGYYFVALDRDHSIVPPEDYRQDTDKSGRKVHNLSNYGICAYPAEYTWRHRRTFIFDAAHGMCSVNNGGLIQADQRMAGRWSQTTQRHRKISMPPRTAKKINPRWRQTTRSARMR